MANLSPARDITIREVTSREHLTGLRSSSISTHLNRQEHCAPPPTHTCLPTGHKAACLPFLVIPHKRMLILSPEFKTLQQQTSVSTHGGKGSADRARQGRKVTLRKAILITQLHMEKGP